MNTSLRLLTLVPALIGLIVLPAATEGQSGMTLTLLSQPCRVADTRVVDGPLQANEIWTFSVEAGFAPLQGGTVGCSVPLTARAVKVIVKGQPLDSGGGYFRVFNASASVFGPFSSLQLGDQGTWTSTELDVPVDGNLQVALHTIVRAQAVVDISGYYTPVN